MCFIDHIKTLTKISRQLAITASEICAAETMWFPSIQYTSYPKVVGYLDGLLHKKSLLVNQFWLYLDKNHVVHCKGRLGNSTLFSETKRPILLPKEGVFMRSLIKHVHETNLRSGVRDTLVCLREKYWVIKGWQVVRSVVKLCVLCKKHEGLPYNIAMPPDLPSARVSDDPHVGLDFADPMFAEDKSG